MEMYRSVESAFAAVLVSVLLGCGGGGSDGGTESPPLPLTPVAEFKLTVEIAGTAATPDVTGKYTVLPGQSVVVKSNEAASWVGSDMGSGVTRTDVDTGVSQWFSRFENPSAVLSGAYKLTASASGGRTKTVDFSVQTGDYRNGDYVVFAANGSRQTLSIDFDAATYSVRDAAGVTTTGTLTAPVAPGKDWTVQNSRIVGVNTSSLRSVKDSIVGGFPFAVPYSAPTTYAAYPFVASRAFVLTQSKLDGVYDRANIQHLVAGGQSAISQFEISAGGTVMRQCVAAAINRVSTCPVGSVITSNIEADTQAGMWQLKNPTTGASLGRFGVVDIEGDKIYLAAGTSAVDGSQVLTIGVPTTPGATAFTSTGWSTSGTLDVSNATSTKYEMSMTVAGVSVLDLTLGGVGPLDSVGIYPAIQANVYFTMRSKRLELLIGARSSPQAGFLHVGIVD
jgi:hypothetical protein